MALSVMAAGDIQLFPGIRVFTGIEHDRAQCHRRRRQILHLFEPEIESVHFTGKVFHVLLRAAGMTRYEIWYQLIAQSLCVTYLLKILVQSLELCKRRFTHQRKNTVFGMFRRYFQASRGVVYDQFTQVPTVVRFVEQIVTDTAADERPCDALRSADFVVKRSEPLVAVV